MKFLQRHTLIYSASNTTICSITMSYKLLSPLEQETMNVVWELKHCNTRDVLRNLNRTKRRAYTTVATLLQRLHEKGMVYRNNDNSVFIYSPKHSKTQYGKTLVHSFMHKFFKSFGDTAIASFAESIEELPREKKDYFLKLLE